MIIAYANVMYWTNQGMRETQTSDTTGYISVREVEQLMERAYQQGYEQRENNLSSQYRVRK